MLLQDSILLQLVIDDCLSQLAEEVWLPQEWIPQQDPSLQTGVEQGDVATSEVSQETEEYEKAAGDPRNFLLRNLIENDRSGDKDDVQQRPDHVHRLPGQEIYPLRFFRRPMLRRGNVLVFVVKEIYIFGLANEVAELVAIRSQFEIKVVSHLQAVNEISGHIKFIL